MQGRKQLSERLILRQLQHRKNKMITALLAGFILSGAGLICILLASSSPDIDQNRKEAKGKTDRRSSFSGGRISSIQTSNW